MRDIKRTSNLFWPNKNDKTRGLIGQAFRGVISAETRPKNCFVFLIPLIPLRTKGELYGRHFGILAESSPKTLFLVY